MIESVEITNYQAHKFSSLSFHKGLNVISGRTHSGKSSIVRALRLLILNKPRGFKFKRIGAGKDEAVSVGISFSDGSVVIIEKNQAQGINLYRSSEHKDPFEAIRTDVPSEISDIIGLGEENIQAQGDRYFLIGKPPGQVAKELNRVIGISIIDEKRAKAKAIVSKAKSNLDSLRGQLSDLKGDFESDRRMREVALADDALKAIEERDSKLRKAEGDFDHIVESVEIIKDLNEEVLESEHLSKASPEIVKILSKIDSIDGYLYEAKVIEESIWKLKESYEDIQEAKGVEAAEAPVISLVKRVSELEKRRFKALEIEGAIEDIRELNAAVAEALQDAEDYEKVKARLEKTLKEKSNYCEACGAHRKHWRK